MRILVSISILVLAFLIPLVAHATTRVVPTNYATIQAGINASVTNDTVLVLPGPYSGAGNWDLTISGKVITILGQGGSESVVIDCQDAIVHDGVASITSGTVLKGLSITNAAVGIDCGSASPHVDSCHFTNSSIAAVRFGPNGFPVFSGNVYFNNLYNIAQSGGTITVSGTWNKDGEEPYVVLTDLVVSDFNNQNRLLTIPA
ncbi:MAG: hypothetical protein JXA92_12540, partial [candidate division Zixibacteria bacterium]|nr:hypothetical protein [candidate division Zixibacteria bacterium]